MSKQERDVHCYFCKFKNHHGDFPDRKKEPCKSCCGFSKFQRERKRN